MDCLMMKECRDLNLDWYHCNNEDCFCYAQKCFISHTQGQEIIKLKKQVEELQDKLDDYKSDQKFLNALMAAGVDNWDGYDYAQEMLNG